MSTPTPTGKPNQEKEKLIRVSDNPLDFRQFYFNYAKYHYNPTNKLIHMVFIPQLIFTIWALSHYGPSYTLNVMNYEVNIDIPIIIITTVCSVFSLVDTLISMLCVIFGLMTYFISLYLYQNDQELFGGNHFKIMLTIHIVSWLFQFVGHGIYEKRAPALTENVFLLFLAPFFLVLELLHLVFGYKAKEMKETNLIIAREIDQFRRLKKAKQNE